MECPVCKKRMEEEDFGDAHVDVCAGCHGIWFDWFELSKLDEEDEGFGKALKEALKYDADHEKRKTPIKCPKCGMRMHQHKYQMANQTDVDECYNCGGFFLDAGELKTIRENAMTEEEREEYTEALIAQFPDVEKERIDLEKRKERAKALNNFTKYIRLSYYLKGE